MGQKTTTLENWDFYRTLSNRRLSVNTVYTSYKLDWSIDRITVIGELDTDFTSLISEDGEIIPLGFNEVGQLLSDYGFAKEAGHNRFNLVDKFEENIAYFELVKFHENKARIDFNPNKLGAILNTDLQTFIRKLFKDPHFSRADIAVDIFNLPNELMRQYKINAPVSYRPIYGRAGDLQTSYWGSSASERQVRMYNKFIEQSRKKQYIPEEIETWWRLEVQLRRSKADDWNNVVRETLETFCAENFIPLDWKTTDRMLMKAFIEDHNFWEEVSRPTKYKYRKMFKDVVEHDELTQELFASFDEEKDRIRKELNEWLRGIKVAEF